MTSLKSSAPQQQASANFVPPAYDQPHVWRQVNDVLQQVADVIAPVWPLKDYVAVNPYSGISARSFMDARAFLKVFSDCETLMPLDHYAQQFRLGRFSVSDIEAAIAETALPGTAPALASQQIAQRLAAMATTHAAGDQPAAADDHARRIKTIAEYATGQGAMNWSEAIGEEVSKYCSAHYDQGQAAWQSPWKHLPLYQAWRSAAQHDRHLEVLGLSGLRRYVAQLPHTAEAAIVHSLRVLKLPQPLWATFLLCQAFSIAGWSAWAKYQDSAGDDPVGNHLTGLLAMRLAYDAALSQALQLSVNWASLVDKETASFLPGPAGAANDAALRHILLRASEIGYRNSLLRSLSAPPAAAASRPLVQMVFCIDVRSERIRRQLESLSGGIETLGFAGFFGMPIEFVPMGEKRGHSHVPVLLKPQFQLHEGLHANASVCESTAIKARGHIRSWRSLWKGFQSSPLCCFSFVETTGLFYGIKLLCQAIGATPRPAQARLDGLCEHDHDSLRPTLRGLNHQGVTTSRQADLAESMLKNLGLTKDFARLVVFCGHASTTENNPLAAGLDCGACGGHSGEPNARMAAMLLNQPYIRAALRDRGIKIPRETQFVAALHNTTTDAINFFDVDELPASHQQEFQQLLSHCGAATKQTQTERMPILASRSLDELRKRAGDWSEVRPEWGLAGNAAFIVAPRSLTRDANLAGQTFLHSYDHEQDPQGNVLETIMTAPMIVAHWINMQYYASTVDNRHFGSGNKTIHNVVGRFGILSGNSGDLMTGLPWQSLHDGRDYQHLPMRLQVVIAAPLESIDRVIDKHEGVADLLSGGWLHLIALAGGETYRYSEARTWQPIGNAECAA